MEFSLKFQPPHFPSHTYTAVAGNKFKVLFSKNSFSFMIYFHLIYNLHALFLPQPHFPPFLFRRYAIFTQFCDISLYLSISCFLLFLTSYCRKCVLQGERFSNMVSMLFHSNRIEHKSKFSRPQEQSIEQRWRCSNATNF